jgi:hypothetical protein
MLSKKLLKLYLPWIVIVIVIYFCSFDPYSMGHCPTGYRTRQELHKIKTIK